MLRKIALSSMKGRKKDTLILSSVIILSFIFITITTVFHTSSERTKYEQKTAMFGKWDLAYYNGDKEIEEKLLGLNDVEKLGVSRIIGGSSTCGIVGTFNQDLMDLGYFNLHEGRMPENNDEIALELNQLKEFSGDIKVGDTIPVKIEVSVINRDSYDVSMEQANKVISEIFEKANELGLKTDEHVKLFYYNYRDNYKRNTRSLEAFNDTEIAISTSYIYEYIKLDLNGVMEQEDYIESQFERIETDGSILKQKAYIKRDMIVTGIFETYSIYWDKGYHSIANAFITEDTGEDLIEKGYYLTKEIDASAYKTPKHLFIDTKLEVKDFYDKYSEEFEKLKINSFLHSQTEYETENTLTFGILLSVFIATMLTVFLIYFTQMKRRARRIALQKSIGATNGQIGKLFFWELFYILTMTIPIGIASGISIGKIILFITNKYGKTKLNFHIDYRLTGLGVSIGVLAILISMLVPIIISMKIPLTGTISEPPKRKRALFRIEKGKIKSKELGIHNSPKKINPKIKQVNLNMKIQTFSKISLKNIKYHKGKHLLTLGLYTINITVLLGCIFLSFLFFGDYINNIIITGKPSYGYEVNYGMIKKEIKEFTEELNSIKGVKDVTVIDSRNNMKL